MVGLVLLAENAGASKRDHESLSDRYDVGFRLVLPAEDCVPVRPAVYAGKQMAEAQSVASVPDQIESLELWFETIGAEDFGYIDYNHQTRENHNYVKHDRQRTKR